MRLRTLVPAALGALALAGSLMTAVPASADDFSGPDRGFAPPNTVLRDAAPAEVGLDPAPIAEAVDLIHAHEEAPAGSHPLYAGAVGIMGHDGRVVERDASGWALRYADRDDRAAARPVGADARRHRLRPRVRVQALHLDRRRPARRGGPRRPREPGRGLPAGVRGCTARGRSPCASCSPTRRASPPGCRSGARTPTGPRASRPSWTSRSTNPAGSTYLYSDLNLITLGVMVERLRGAPLDVVVHDRITAPLGMADTGYNPTRPRPHGGHRVPDRLPRAAWSAARCTTRTPGRSAASPGHAGVFSTADDLAVLSQALLNGGTYDGERILSRKSVEALITELQRRLPGRRPRSRLRARPALVHGHAVGAAHRRPHRLHRAPRSSSTSPRGRSRSCSPTACTPLAPGARSTSPGASGRTGSERPWPSGPSTATPPGSPVARTPRPRP